MDSWTLGFYWGARKESAGSCARRLSTFLHALEDLDVSIRDWRPVSAALATRGHKSLSQSDLEQLFLQGVNRNDVDRAVIEDLGYSVRLKNWAPKSAFEGVSVHCGCWSQWVGNSCVIGQPFAGAQRLRLLSTDVLKRVCAAAATAWEPEFGGVFSKHLRETTSVKSLVWSIGWITYLSSRYGEIPALNAPSYVESMGSGSLIVVTDERYSNENSQHVEAARRVAVALNLRRRAPADLVHPTTYLIDPESSSA